MGENEFKWIDKWNKTKGEILRFLGGQYTISVKLSKGAKNALRLEKKGRRIEISNTISKTILREWCFYSDGGWKTTGYEEYFGITKERDAISDALRTFATQSIDTDSYLIKFLEVSE